MFLFGCKNTNKEESIVHYYYKAMNEDKVVAFQKRSYTESNDTISENVITLLTNDSLIEKSRKRYIKSQKGLEIIINNKSQSFLQFSKENPCTIYQHPMQYDIKNCYIETSNYKGYKNVIVYNHSQELIDGLSMTIYLDDNYALIEKVEIIGTGNYDKLIRVEKDSITIKAQKKLGGE